MFSKPNWKTVSNSIKRLKELDEIVEGGAAEGYTKKERLNLDRERDKLTVLRTAPLLAEAIMRVHTEQSLSVLFSRDS